MIDELLAALSEPAGAAIASSVVTGLLALLAIGLNGLISWHRDARQKKYARTERAEEQARERVLALMDAVADTRAGVEGPDGEEHDWARLAITHEATAAIIPDQASRHAMVVALAFIHELSSNMHAVVLVEGHDDLESAVTHGLNLVSKVGAEWLRDGHLSPRTHDQIVDLADQLARYADDPRSGGPGSPSF